MTEINKLSNLKKIIIIPNYEILGNNNKKKLNFIHYNFLNKKKFLIKKNYYTYIVKRIVLQNL